MNLKIQTFINCRCLCYAGIFGCNCIFLNAVFILTVTAAESGNSAPIGCAGQKIALFIRFCYILIAAYRVVVLHSIIMQTAQPKKRAALLYD